MSELVSLKQSGLMEDYYDHFLSILIALQLIPEYVVSIFTSNLNPDIAKAVRLFHPKSITHAFILAKQLESLSPNTFKKTISSLQSTTSSTPKHIQF